MVGLLAVPVLHSLRDFIEFASGLTGIPPQELAKALKEAARERRAASIHGYTIEVDAVEREIRLSRNGVVLAVYRGR